MNKQLKKLVKESEEILKRKEQNLKDLEQQKEKLNTYKEFFKNHPDFFMGVLLALNDEWNFIPPRAFYQVVDPQVDDTYNLINKGRRYIELSETNEEYQKIIDEIKEYIKFMTLVYVNDLDDLRNRSKIFSIDTYLN